jgi:hypothetical protein
MRLNPFYPSDDPMSSVFYCFGGGGGGGGGGGDSRSEADRSYEDDFGFSSDLADKYSGSAADVGGRDNNGGDNRPAPAPAPAPSPSPSAMDTAIANALANIDTAWQWCWALVRHRNANCSGGSLSWADVLALGVMQLTFRMPRRSAVQRSDAIAQFGVGPAGRVSKATTGVLVRRLLLRGPRSPDLLSLALAETIWPWGAWGGCRVQRF